MAQQTRQPAAQPARTGPRNSHVKPRTGHQNPFVVLAIVLAATFVQLVDLSIVNTAIPSIQRELHASYAAIQLVLVFYQLAFACTLITAARLGDIYGRRRMFVIGMTGFTVASALCGAAPTATVLVFGRLVQGLTSGLMFPQVLSVIQVTFPPNKRGKAFGIYGAVIGLATILGPLVGGALIQLNLFGLDWRTIFYVNLPVGVVALVAALYWLGESTAPNANRLDVRGAVLVTLGLFLLVYPLTEGREKGWPAWLYLMLVAAVPVLAAFAVLEVRKTGRRDSPLVLTTLFGDRAFRAGLVMTTVFFLALPPFFFIFSLYIQIGEGFTALGAGLTTFAFAMGSGIASAASDRVAQRVGNTVLKIGTAVITVGSALTVLTAHLAGTHPHSYQFAPALFVSGLGLGLFVAPVVTIILSGIQAEGAGSASGVLSTAQQVGGAIGVAVIGVIFFGLLGTNAGTASAQVSPGLRSGLSALGLPSPAVQQIVGGFGRCFADRSHAKDPTQDPASCRQLRQRGQDSPAPPAVRAQVGALIAAQAAPTAMAKNFSRSFQQALVYEVVMFGIAFGLTFALPNVRPRPVPNGGSASPA